ncbi:HNH endonuclease [Pedobacter suwonensis]|uniref:HNH endonuclease n=2 Tax=cellular organisms TaxID=131567 RepID=UPI003CFCA722
MVEFAKDYAIQVLVSCPEEANKKWIPKKDRTCRFCKKRMPEVNFKMDAHLIPQFLGNKNLICQDECDTCNSRFSTFETDLSAYLGPLNSLFSREGKKNRVPKFNVPGSPLSAKPTVMYGAKVTEVENEGMPMEVNITTGSAKLSYKKSPYTPINVYKILCKMAYCLLPESEIAHDDPLRIFLLGNSLDQHFSIFATVQEYTLPLDYPRPEIRMFKRVTASTKLISHVCMLYFGNMMFEFLLPGNICDDYMKGKVDLQQKFCPPFFFQPYRHAPFFSNKVDFTSLEKRKAEEGFIYLNFDPGQLKNLKGYDTINERWTDKNLADNEIVKLIFGKMDTEMKFPDKPMG